MFSFFLLIFFMKLLNPCIWNYFVAKVLDMDLHLFRNRTKGKIMDASFLWNQLKVNKIGTHSLVFFSSCQLTFNYQSWRYGCFYFHKLTYIKIYISHWIPIKGLHGFHHIDIKMLFENTIHRNYKKRNQNCLMQDLVPFFLRISLFTFHL